MSLPQGGALLVIGKTLGHYEITAKLGEGGMGEVYLATDSRLGRQVALKILPSHLTENEALRQRLEREARVISSLNHNHICTLFDIGAQDGVDYLAMEYLEGETLDERLKRGPLPLDEALTLGRQIADALDVAHRSGITHRDLKPGNIMLTPSGAKLLDFGLAKSRESSTSEPDLTSLPTEADKPLTREGAILGTLQYMAPEQLEGKKVDARADIFALGLLLYEMVSGKRAFDGDSQASLIAAIMSSQPASMSDLAPVSPPALERVVAACMRKDPDERIQSAHDVKLQLEWITEGDEDTSITVTSTKTRVPVLPWILVAVLGLIAAWFAIRGSGQKDTLPRETTRLSVALPPSLRLVPEPVEISISPDGKMVAFVAADSTGAQTLWVRRLDDLKPYSIPGTEGGFAHFWSPDSQHLAYFIDGSMLRVEASGGRPPRVICDVVSGRGGTWNADDLIVYAGLSQGPLFSVPASGGTPTQITTLDKATGETAQRYPTFLPDGRHFLYVSIIGTTRHDTKVGSIDGGEPVHVLTADGMAVYSEAGYLIYERRNALLASPFDVESLKIAGDPIDLIDRAGGDRNWYGSMPVKCARDDMLYIVFEKAHELVWFDQTGTRLGTIPVLRGDYQSPVLSPDGRRVAVERRTERQSEQLWIIELDRNILAPVTTDFDSSYPIWSPDGQILTFASRRGGTRNVYIKTDRGHGAEQELVKMEGVFANPMSWSPDGRTLLIRNLSAETNNDIFIYSRDDETVEPFIVTRNNEANPSISHDGRWVAYASDESGRPEIYVQTYPDLRSKTQVSIGGCGGPADGRRVFLVYWGPNDDEIFYLGADSYTIMRVAIETEPTVRAGRPEVLFRMPQGSTWFNTIDGERFLVSLRSDLTQELVVVDDWAAEIDRP